MRRGLIFSASLHAVIILAALVSAPFNVKSTSPFDEVIRVQLTAPNMIPAPQPAAAEPVSVPSADVEEELPDIPISSPETVESEAVIPTEPEPEKPKPQPEKPKPKPQNTRPAQETESGSSGGSGDDESETEVGGGTPFAGATVDNASFDYPYWFTQAFNKINSNWHNRVAYSGALVCVVSFQVIKSGRVIEVRVEESSGIPEFDESCVRAVNRSAPFPPLPQSFVDEIIGIRLPFKYDPR